jgi:hypothetical protein
VHVQPVRQQAPLHEAWGNGVNHVGIAGRSILDTHREGALPDTVNLAVHHDKDTLSLGD